MIKYLVIYEKTGTGYSAYIPDLPGCVATGETKAMVEENIYEAIKFHLEGLREEGIPLPEQMPDQFFSSCCFSYQWYRKYRPEVQLNYRT